MAYIKTLSYEEADDELKAVYDNITGSRGKLAEVHKIQSLNPPALMAHMDLYLKVMFGKSPLKRYQREMLGVVVSAANRCPYCIEHHRQALLFYWKDDERTRRFIANPSEAGLGAGDLALCRFAKALTVAPWESGEEQIEALRRAGFDDRSILDATQVIAYFNFVNRMVLALGVEFNDEEASGYNY